MSKPLPRECLRRAFAICIRELRTRAGLAQEDLAHAADIDRAYMSGLERGKHTASLEKLYRILRALKLSFAEFGIEFDKALREVKREYATRTGQN